MQIETPEIQIDTAYCCRIIIRYKYFRMYKSRCILIDLHSAFNQFFIICLCYRECIPFIRNMRHDDDHFNTTFGCTYKCCQHLIIQYQIRSHDMHILLRMIQDMEIHLFSNVLMVKRTVRIWDHVSQSVIQ